MPQIDYTLDQVRREGIAIDRRTLKWFLAARNHGEVLAGFWAAGPIARVARLARIRTRHDATFLLPRLLGIRTFARVRSLIEQRRTSRPTP